MRNREFVRGVYKSAWCDISPFAKYDEDQRFIVRYWHSNHKLRATPVGWGKTHRAAWKDAANYLNQHIMQVLEN